MSAAMHWRHAAAVAELSGGGIELTTRCAPMCAPATATVPAAEQQRRVERAQLTSLEECRRPAFARSLVPKTSALARDLDEYLTEYHYDRARTGA